MKLNLKRPLAFFDLETTGTNVSSDRIVEISIVKILTDNTKDIYTKKVNPTIPIPQVVSEIHGIYDKDIIAAPTFEYIAEEVFEFIKGCDMAGYNSNRFDVPLLSEEFLRVNESYDISDRKFVDVQTIFHKMEQRTLVAAYKYYCGKELTNAHSAEADTMATFEVLEAQLDRYSELENDVDFLADFSKGNRRLADFAGRIVFNEDDVEAFNFGKHKDKTLVDVFTAEPSYYAWMMNADFPMYTKKVLKRVWKSMKTVTD
ncbi:MAG: DNA polymerase-3 subunit epsilon [Patiriisocius sp.]|jgi:DNA polymerase-3 subunit epsilon